MKYTIICLILAFSAGATAQTYTVGVEQSDFMPHYGVDQQGKYIGFGRELLDMFARYADITLNYQPMPVAELAPSLAAGDIDFKYPDNPEWTHPDSVAGKVSYSKPAVEYVDGVLVAPRRKGLGLDHLKRLAVVEGWTPRGYQDKIAASDIQLLHNDDLPEMIRQVLLKHSDGAYYNVVVALHYINNVRARPDVLVFDPDLPHVRGTFRLSTLQHPTLIQAFDGFLEKRQQAIEALKTKYQIEANIDSEYFGLEQWKVDYLKRQKARDADN